MKHLLAWFAKLIFLLTLFAAPRGWSQTILQPGDLVVIGLGANVGGDLADCNTSDGLNSGRDLVSFVCFKDIEPGTTIDITDNGWERARPGLWGNVEGFLRITRTGVAIPAGTVVVFEFPPDGTDYLARLPDADWSFQSLGTNTLNFNSNGDQLYFLQGGEWDNGDTVGCCNGDQNANYSGGRILFGFNTQTDWISLEDDSRNSGLHPDVTPCFHMEPTGGTTNFISYTGPLEPASQLEWIGRIADAANWSTFPDCSTFLSDALPIAMLQLAPSNIDLECTVCQGCEDYQDTLTFRLPESDGPFTVEYTDGRDTFLEPALVNGSELSVDVGMTTRYQILSITSNRGCPLYSNLGEGATMVVTENLRFLENNLVGPFCESSADGRGFITFMGGTPPFSLEWLSAGPFQTDSLLDRTFFISGLPEGTITYRISDGAGCSFTQELLLQAGNAHPIVDCTISQPPTMSGGTGTAALAIEVGSLPSPFTVEWSGPVNGNTSVSVSGTIEIPDLPIGQYQAEVTAANGCSESCSFLMPDPSCEVTLTCEVLKQVSTSGGADGEASLSFDRGTPPYSLEWIGPVTDSIIENTAGKIILSTLPPGDYLTTVTDADDCISSCSFTITAPTCNTQLDLTVQNQACNGLPEGAILAEVSGATGQIRYDWNDNALDGLSNPDQLSAGTYTLITVDEANCRDTASATIQTAEGVTAQVTAFVEGCDATEGTIRVENISGGSFPYSLTVGGSTPINIDELPYSATGYTPGDYEIAITDNDQCSFRTELSITASASLLLNINGPNGQIKAGDSTLLEAVTNFAPIQVSWEPAAGISDPDSLITFAQPAQTTTYFIRAEDENGCEISESIVVEVDQTRSLFIPSAFTPNNDGRNDLLSVFGGEDVLAIKSFHVFDRWGSLIFQSNSIDLNNQGSGWDGTFRGQLMPAGTYIYFAEVIFLGNREGVVEGSINLIR